MCTHDPVCGAPPEPDPAENWRARAGACWWWHALCLQHVAAAAHQLGGEAGDVHTSLCRGVWCRFQEAGRTTRPCVPSLLLQPPLSGQSDRPQSDSPPFRIVTVRQGHTRSRRAPSSRRLREGRHRCGWLTAVTTSASGSLKLWGMLGCGVCGRRPLRRRTFVGCVFVADRATYTPADCLEAASMPARTAAAVLSASSRAYACGPTSVCWLV